MSKQDKLQEQIQDVLTNHKMFLIPKERTMNDPEANKLVKASAWRYIGEVYDTLCKN